jgi:hypothetical protein
MPNHFRSGMSFTMRRALPAHAGEALESRNAFQELPGGEQDASIEFLKTLKVLARRERRI